MNAGVVTVVVAAALSATKTSALGWIAAEGAVPPDRGFSATAYDAARGEVVLFGGATGDGGNTILDDTWLWNGDAWREATPAVSPAGRIFHTLAYDAANERVVLFGGFVSGAPTDETWLWDGTAWTRATPQTTPPARGEHALAYDRARERVVLFSGLGEAGALLSDTWTFDGETWTLEAPLSVPPGRTFHRLAFDGRSSTVLLFGGLNVPDFLGVGWRRLDRARARERCPREGAWHRLWLRWR